MHYMIEIETAPDSLNEPEVFEAHVITGPAWLRSLRVREIGRAAAYAILRHQIEQKYAGRHTFEVFHAAA